MLSQSCLPHEFWAEAVNTAAYLVNFSPSSATGFKTPFEMRYGRPADYSHLRVFGCDAYVLTPSQLRSKLEAKSKKCILLGYQRGVKGYRLWDPVACKLIVSRDVSFNESRSSKEGENSQSSRTDKGKSPIPDTVEGEISHEGVHDRREVDAPGMELVPVMEQEEQVIVGVPQIQPAAADQPESSTRRTSSRSTRAPTRYGQWADSSKLDDIDIAPEDDQMALILEEGEPSSYQEACASEQKHEWNAAMQRELQSLSDNKTWELVKLPSDQQVVDSKWVYKLKDSPSDGGDKIYKARLVAKGFTQEKGVDYNEVFSPVAKYSTIRILCQLVVFFDLVLDQMDVVTAFLYGTLDELIFMRQPLGFVKKGQEGLVCRLLKSLYGLKQAPRQWNKRFDDFMLGQGFTRMVYDPCVYRKSVKNDVFGFIILVLYVDDMLIVAKDQSEVDRLKVKLSSEFRMKDLGKARRILGMEIFRNSSTGQLCLNQGKYARKVLARFSMEDCKPVSIPLASHFKLSSAFSPTDAVEKGLMAKIPYEKAVGSLMYLMTCTRPDLALAMGKVSRFMSNPGKVHWEAVKWMLRYLKGTEDYGLLFDRRSDRTTALVGYVDSDYGGCLDTRRSTTGYVFTLGGGCISWKSTLQKCISQSTTEAEYVAAAEATKEAIWLDRLITEMGLEHGKMTLNCDSQSALHLAANQVMDSRVKHIDIRYHFIRQAVSDKTFELVKIDGKLNPADAFTKVIPLESFSRHRATLQVLQL